MAAVGPTVAAVAAVGGALGASRRGVHKIVCTLGARITPIWLLWGPLWAQWRRWGRPGCMKAGDYKITRHFGAKITPIWLLWAHCGCNGGCWGRLGCMKAGD